MNEIQKSHFLIYRTEDGKIKIDVRFEDETVWLTQAMIAELFSVEVQNITMHIRHVYEEGELLPESTCKDFLQVQKEETRNVSGMRKYYNLDMIISVGYRIPFFQTVQNKMHWAITGKTAAEIVAAGKSIRKACNMEVLYGK